MTKGNCLIFYLAISFIMLLDIIASHQSLFPTAELIYRTIHALKEITVEGISW